MSREPEFRKSSHSLNNATCVEVAFSKSSFSSGGNCVEVAFTRAAGCGSSACVEVGRDGTEVLVRDSKDLNSPVLRYTAEEWKAFIAGAKSGEFDV